MPLFQHEGLLLGRDLAGRLEVSLRTIYRDIETLVHRACRSRVSAAAATYCWHGVSACALRSR
ncbi:helix-turn-helix domain-containing protein [Polymorphobacter multimanifer]|uniref:helix-turn-helix domain-containing protein n=1 Tax=Polymorphobacter multimanifer TaxID=1070431 RepID=UPI001A9CA464